MKKKLSYLKKIVATVVLLGPLFVKRIIFRGFFKYFVELFLRRTGLCHDVLGKKTYEP